MPSARLKPSQGRSLIARFPSLGGIASDVRDFIIDSDCSRYLGNNFVCLDFEVDTSHGDYGHPIHPENQLLLACWENGADHPRPGRFSDWGGEFEQQRLIADIEAADFIVAHNAKYELGWLKRCGVPVHELLVFDTKIAEYVLSGNLTSLVNFNTSLDACCKRRGLKAKDPVVDLMIKSGINPVRIPRPWLLGRCKRDVSETKLLFEDQREMLDRRGQLQVLFTRCILTPVLVEIEANGMWLDKDRVGEELKAAEEKLLKAQLELQQIADINWNSNTQVAEKLYGELGFEELSNRKGPIRTAGDKPKTDQATIEKLKAVTPEQKAFKTAYQALNKASAALSKNLRFFQACCEKQDGQIHFTFNQTRTSTHRLSSSGVPVDGYMAQGQNLPNQYKRLFTARTPGHLVTEWDGSGLEFRGAGLISRDPMILADINGGRDPHAFSGSVINRLTYEEFMDRKREKDPTVLKWRKEAKAHTFKPLFGGESGTASQKRYYDAFKRRYSALEQAQTAWSYEAAGKKSLRTPWGLTFYFPHAKIEADGYINVKTKAFNYPIQSISTAEIIPLAATFFYHLVVAHGLEHEIRLVNTVHDSVICEVNPDFLEEYKEFAKQTWFFVYWYFEERYGFPLEGLPLGTEITWGSHWSEGDSEAFNIHQDGRIESDE